MTQARAWLPAGALDDGTLAALVSGAVEAWSAKWILRGSMEVVKPLAPIVGPAPAGRWRVLPEGAALAVEEEAELALAAMMLDAATVARAPTEADRRLCHALAQTAITDLCRRLASAFGLPGDSLWRDAEARAFDGSGFGCEIGRAGQPAAMQLRVSTESAVAVRRGSARSVPQRSALGPLDEALAKQRVGLSARLGRCHLTLAEFTGLGPGDVLILDQDPAGPLDLTVEGADPPVARCAIEEDGHGYRLKILELTKSTDT
jgi:flagellar motor switch/type III secretory pathway protein FliN